MSHRLTLAQGPRSEGPERRLLWGIWTFSAPSILSLLCVTGILTYDQRNRHPFNDVTVVGGFGVMILAFSAFVTCGIATIYLALLLASRGVPPATKVRGAVIATSGWLVAWTAWKLFTYA